MSYTRIFCFLLCGVIGATYAGLQFDPFRLVALYPYLGGTTTYSVLLENEQGLTAGIDAIHISSGNTSKVDTFYLASGTTWSFSHIDAEVVNGVNSDHWSFLMPSFFATKNSSEDISISIDTSFAISAKVSYGSCADSVFILGELRTSFLRNGKPQSIKQSRSFGIDGSLNPIVYKMGVSPEPAFIDLKKMHSEFVISGRCGNGQWSKPIVFESRKTSWTPRHSDSVDLGPVSIHFPKSLIASPHLVGGSVLTFIDSLYSPSWISWQAWNRDSLLPLISGNYSGSVENLQQFSYFHLPWSNSKGWGYWNELESPEFTGENSFGASQFKFPFLDGDSILGFEANIGRISDAIPGLLAGGVIWNLHVLDGVEFPLTKSGTYGTPAVKPFQVLLQLVNSGDTSIGSIRLSGVKDYYSNAKIVPPYIAANPTEIYREKLSVPTGKIAVLLQSNLIELVNPIIYLHRTGNEIGVEDGQSCDGVFSRIARGTELNVSGALLPGTYVLEALTHVGAGWSRFAKKSFSLLAGDNITLSDSLGDLRISEIGEPCRLQDSLTFRVDGVSGSLSGLNVPVFVNGAFLDSVTLNVSGTTIIIEKEALETGKNQLEVRIPAHNGLSNSFGRFFYWRGKVPIMDVSSPANDVINYTNDSYSYIGDLVTNNKSILSLSVNGAPVQWDFSGKFTGTISTTKLNNQFTSVAVDVCGDSLTISRSITRKNTVPTADFNCAQLQKSFPGTVFLDGRTSADADGDDLQYEWSRDGVLVSSTVVDSVAFGGLNTTVFNLTVKDRFGVTDNKSCAITPGINFVRHICGSDSDKQPCSAPGSDGPEFESVFLRSSPNVLSMLFAMCENEEQKPSPFFESDQYIVLDADGDATTGKDGFEVRYGIDFLRGVRADSSMKVNKENWNGSKWIRQSSYFPNGQTSIFDINNANGQTVYDSFGLVLDAGEGSQLLPNGDTISANRMIELQVPAGNAGTSVRWYFDGQKQRLGRSDSAYRHIVESSENSIVIDGLSCDWLGSQKCSVMSDGVEGFGSGWTTTNTETVLSQVTSGCSQGSECLKVEPSMTFSGEVVIKGSVAVPATISSATLLTFDVLYLVPETWIVSPITASYLGTIGNISITSSMRDGLWHSASISLSPKPIPESMIDVSISFHIQPSAISGAILVDNLRFE